jgi:DNA-binding NtrC family response regulator
MGRSKSPRPCVTTRHCAGGPSTVPPARLLRLHRHSLSNLIVLGGTGAERLAVARAFHRASPLRGAPFLGLDCGGEEPRLRCALQIWLLPETGGPWANPLHDCECGTLFLDSVGCLSSATQRLLLLFARRLHGDRTGARDEPGPCRLAVGSAEDLGGAVEERRFSPALYDCLDKIRIELAPVPKRGAA